MPGINS